MRWVAALVCLVACSGTWWREVEPRHIEHDEQLFIVTAGHAYVLEVTARSADAITGAPIRAWSFPASSFSVRLHEPPVETARRLGWKAELVGEAPTTIRIGDVLYASHQREASTLDSSVPFFAVLTRVFVMFAAASIYVIHGPS